MLKKTVIIFFTILVVILNSAALQERAQAQTASWRVTVFDRSTGLLHYLTPAGIQPGPVIALPEGSEIWNAALSPDDHYFVFVDDQGVWVADLLAGTCCTPLTAPDSTLFSTYISPISPDGTQIAISMSSEAVFTSTGGVDVPVLVFDLASGQVVASLLLSQLQAIDYQPSAVQFGDWRADGLRLIPSCWGCEGTWEGLYQLWDPATNTLTPPVEPFDIFMQRLPTTGEIIKANAHPDYPQSGFPSAYFAPSNVVEYYPSVTAPDGMAVYFNPNSVYVNGVDWVVDGQAFLAVLGGRARSSADNLFDTTMDNESVLVFRDGHQVPVPMPGYNVLTGTPDGWIAWSWQTGESAIVQLLPGDQLNIIPTNAGNSTNWLLVGANFQLGASAVASPFPAAQPPTFVTCPGFATSRLWPNTYAAVSPGEPNNLRDQPNSAGALIGTIPGGEVIAIIEGPQCAEDMAWWHVEYKGVLGWTSEGQGSSYWLEPFGAMMY
ncbi:MAG: SH3 domain-containing protein [Chloroflexi bacterium]|nr:SH3 domain-containing protein [Chloroflexota bacterium]